MKANDDHTKSIFHRCKENQPGEIIYIIGILWAVWFNIDPKHLFNMSVLIYLCIHYNYRHRVKVYEEFFLYRIHADYSSRNLKWTEKEIAFEKRYIYAKLLPSFPPCLPFVHPSKYHTILPLLFSPNPSRILSFTSPFPCLYIMPILPCLSFISSLSNLCLIPRLSVFPRRNPSLLLNLTQRVLLFATWSPLIK